MKQKKASGELHWCPDCRHRRTRATRCGYCQRLRDAERRGRAKLRRTLGTVANCGALAFLKEVARLAAARGFDATHSTETWPGEADVPVVTLAHEDAIKIAVRLFNADATPGQAAGAGSTSFGTAHGWRTFDRAGVEDSFYVEAEDTAAAVDEKVAAQVARVAESRERIARSEAVPGLPGNWLVTPERKAEIRARLAGGGTHQFQPAGFGTGYAVRTRRAPGYAPLPRETAAFFGLPGGVHLYAMPLDCD